MGAGEGGRLEGGQGCKVGRPLRLCAMSAKRGGARRKARSEPRRALSSCDLAPRAYHHLTTQDASRCVGKIECVAASDGNFLRGFKALIQSSSGKLTQPCILRWCKFERIEFFFTHSLILNLLILCGGVPIVRVSHSTHRLQAKSWRRTGQRILAQLFLPSDRACEP